MAKAESLSPSGAVAEGQPFLPHQPPSSSSPVCYGAPQCYVLLPLHRLRLRRPRRGDACCGCCTCALLTASILLLLLSFSIFFLWPSDPEVGIVGVKIDHVHVSTSPIPYLDISMNLKVRVRNPNFFSLHYESLVTRIAYRGRNLGFVTAGDGEVKARGISIVDANLRLDGIKVIKDAIHLIEDLAMGSIPFETESEVDGWIKVFFISFPIKGRMSCSVRVNINNQSVVHQDCYPE